MASPPPVEAKEVPPASGGSAILGAHSSSAGIKPDPGKIEQVREYPVPTDATKVRQFLGLASYYRRFIPEFARIAHPMHALTRKDTVFEWTADCDAAFNKLKELLITAPVLLHPRFGPSEEFILETDASGVGLGAILSQKHDGMRLDPWIPMSTIMQSPN